MLSIVIITLNESRNIERALLSVRGISDDIVVVDSGSTDNTAALCLKHGARVIERVWDGYSGVKNFGNAQAKHSWILSIDADEALSEELRASILKHVIDPIPENKVFSFNRLTNYCGKWIHHCGWYPDRKIRIWHRDFGKWEGMIHEKITFRGTTQHEHLNGDLLHYSYYSRAEHQQQIAHFTSLMADDLFRSGKRTNMFKIWARPVFRFLRDYLVRGGFRDGKAGLSICRGSAYAVHLKYLKLRQLWLIGHQ